MRIFGLTITREKAAGGLSPVDNRGGWWPVMFEPHTGAFQQDIKVNQATVVANHAIFSCQTLIASDCAKLRIKLVEQDEGGIWSEVKNSAYSPVIRKPNHFQNRIQFVETWILSKLQRGNTYALKRRDARGVVNALYVLNPDLVVPLVSPDGSVFYDLQIDNLAGVTESVIVPAREIIHDRFNCLFHPLIGLSPIFANGLAATHGLATQTASTRLFQNGARPGGILTAPGEISEETAERLKKHWDNNYSGANSGKVAVLGDGLRFEAMAMKATDAQLVEQLKWSAEVVCSTYHVPPYKIGIGQQPTHNNVQALNTEYYSQALQVLLESFELCLDEGLGTGEKLGTEFDVENLLRMDSATQMDVLEKSKGILSPNEQRAKLDKKPKPGGDSPMLQQQNYSLEALARRDALDDPFGSAAPAKPDATAQDPANDNHQARAASFALSGAIRRALREKGKANA